MVIIIIWIGFTFITALAAMARGRNPVGWAILGALFGIFALVSVLVMKDVSKVK